MSSVAVGSPRGWLPLFSIYEDSVVTGRGVGADDVYELASKEGPIADTVINKFWNNPKNKDIVDAFMNNKLCVDAAQGKPEAIAAFKKYVVQDYFYLVDWFKFRVLRLATLPHDDFKLDDLSKELDSVHRSLNAYVKDWYITCLKSESEGGLGLEPKDFQVERTIGELAYSQFLLNNARNNNWYSLHIILIGCYWGWSKLALQLYNDFPILIHTVFHQFWMAGNVDIDNRTNQARMSKSARTLSLFLDQNWEKWFSKELESQAQELFRTVLRLEVGLFNSAYDASTKRATLHYTPYEPVLRKPGRRGEQAWKRLLGLESEHDNADEDGNRIREL